MKCINCNQDIKERYSYVKTIDWDSFSYSDNTYERIVKATCKQCKIKYDNGKWIIPKNLQPTDKQKKTVLFIENRLNISFNGEELKTDYWKFISEYFNKAKEVKYYTPVDDPTYDDLGYYFDIGDFH